MVMSPAWRKMSALGKGSRYGVTVWLGLPGGKLWVSETTQMRVLTVDSLLGCSVMVAGWNESVMVMVMWCWWCCFG